MMNQAESLSGTSLKFHGCKPIFRNQSGPFWSMYQESLSRMHGQAKYDPPLRAFPPGRRRCREPGRNRQEPSGTLCQCQKTAHCGKKPQYMYTCYMPCIPQIASSNFQMQQRTTRNDRTWRNHDKSYSLWSVSLQTCLGKDSSLESQQLSILHTLMATVRKFLLTNWLDAMTQGTFWLVRELRELRELFNMVRC